MRKPSFTKRFQKDLKWMQKRGKKTQKIKVVMTKLIAEEPLEKRYRDHLLIGNYQGRRECHIEPDWY
ncbi:type II toxin-antitoxin system YafQ family toxin [Anaerolineales bacterium HSG24]|nr:type II toxin-antitoxin system YafQ family toxin [Anaerolineales bacterium HSG24]